MSIATLTGNNGLLTKTSEAKKANEESKVDELIHLAVLTALADNYGKIESKEALEKALLSSFDKEAYEIISNSKSTYQLIINNNGYVIQNNGKISKTNWIEYEDKTIKSIDNAITLKIGDFVNYNPQTNAIYKSYKSETSKNGWKDQIFNVQNYLQGWQILGTEDGKIKLISENIIGPDIGGKEENNNKYYYLMGKNRLYKWRTGIR